MNAPRGRPTLKTVAVGAVDKVLVSANPKRKGIILCNCDSASTVYLAPNQPATAGQGIALGPVYDDVELTEGDWGQLPGAEWHAIAALAGVAQGAPVPFSTLVAGASLAAAGVVASFTVPAGFSGQLQGTGYQIQAAGAAAVYLEIVRGASTIKLNSSTTSFAYSVPVSLQVGDVVQWRVQTPAAGETADFAISGYTVANAGAVPGTVNVGVIELEG